MKNKGYQTISKRYIVTVRRNFVGPKGQAKLNQVELEVSSVDNSRKKHSFPPNFVRQRLSDNPIHLPRASNQALTRIITNMTQEKLLKSIKKQVTVASTLSNEIMDEYTARRREHAVLHGGEHTVILIRIYHLTNRTDLRSSSIVCVGLYLRCEKLDNLSSDSNRSSSA